MSIGFSEKAKEVITMPIPQGLIKSRKGGGNTTLSYISGSTVIDYLNRAFNYLWTSEIVHTWKEDSVDKFNPKYDKEPQAQNPVVHVQVRLTAYLPQPDGTFFALSHDGMGSKEVMGGQSDQADNFKAASTDALKKAASLFGIGLALYRDEEEQEFFDSINYEDPWTDDLMKKYSEERAFLKDIFESYQMEEDGLDEYVSEFSEGVLTSISQIVPDNISAFVEFLRTKIESAEPTATE